MKIAVAATAPFGAAVLEGMAAGATTSSSSSRAGQAPGQGAKEGAPPAKEVAKRLEIPVRAAGEAGAVPR